MTNEACFDSKLSFLQYTMAEIVRNEAEIVRDA